MNSFEDTSLDWTGIEKRFDELSQEIVSPSLESNRRHTVQKELSYVTTLLNKRRDIVSCEAQLVQLNQQKETADDSELRELYDEEIADVQTQLKETTLDLEKILFPPDPLDDRSVFLEIRAGTGGQEASLFAGDLLRMYTNYALKKQWHVDVASISETDVGGYREIVLHIQGKHVYGHLKYESGVHRVQRVPITESAGRVHTSTATVAVMPEAKEVDFTLNPSDLRIDVYRSSGAGGQHVNTTDSAVRITHIPTGVVVSCQDERSQHKNKAKALKMLQSRLLSAMREKEQQESSLKRKELVGSGMRSEKVRTYNFPQNRVTDHQVDVTLKKLDMVMEGDLDEILDALMEKERIERRKQPLS